MQQVLATGVPPHLHPDRNFDTIACRAGAFMAKFAALELGVCCSVLCGNDAQRVLELLRATDGRESEGIAVREVLGLDEAGRLAVEPLRAWLVQTSGAGNLRAVVNTVGPYLCRPLQMGADVVVEDLHACIDASLLPADSNGACVAVVARSESAWARFWEALPAFDDGQHGAVSPVFAPHATPKDAEAPKVPIAILPEQADSLLCAALPTLSLTSQRRSDNALVVANYLAAHPKVAWVSYPGLADDPANDAARRTLEHGFGPLVTFCLQGAKVDLAAFLSAQPWAECHAEAATTVAVAEAGLHLLRVGLENPLDIVEMLERGPLAPGDAAGGEPA